jgi:hypothetical protein
MKAIEDASVVDGGVVMDDLILTKYNGVQINAGNVRGPIGPAGPEGPAGSGSDPVGAWNTPVLLNNWVNYDAAIFEPAGYYLDRNRVFMRGFIKNGSVGFELFNLAVGFRPFYNIILPVRTEGAPTRMEINTNGDVVLIFETGSNNTWVSLSNISFRID